MKRKLDDGTMTPATGSKRGRSESEGREVSQVSADTPESRVDEPQQNEVHSDFALLVATHLAFQRVGSKLEDKTIADNRASDRIGRFGRALADILSGNSVLSEDQLKTVVKIVKSPTSLPALVSAAANGLVSSNDLKTLQGRIEEITRPGRLGSPAEISEDRSDSRQIDAVSLQRLKARGDARAELYELRASRDRRGDAEPSASRD